MRIRTVKPGLWSSEDMAELSDQALLLALGLLNFADDEGYFTANVALIRAAIFPIRKTSPIDGLLAELAKVRYVELSTGTDGRKYGRICKFSEHQRINRPSDSLIKPLWRDAGALIEDSLNAREGLPECSPPEGKGKERNKEGKGVVNESDEFMNAWNALPTPFPRIRAMSTDRKATLRTRLKDPFWRDNWLAALTSMPGRPFLAGTNSRGWIADVDFFLRPDSVLKLIEGKYQDAQPVNGDLSGFTMVDPLA